MNECVDCKISIDHVIGILKITHKMLLQCYNDSFEIPKDNYPQDLRSTVDYIFLNL